MHMYMNNKSYNLQQLGSVWDNLEWNNFDIPIVIFLNNFA